MGQRGKTNREIAKLLGMNETTLSSYKATHDELKKAFEKEKRFCCMCGKVLINHQDKCCSIACITAYRLRERKTIACMYCGKEFRERRYQGENTINRFCSKSCSSLFYGAIKRENAERKAEQIKKFKELQREADRISAEIKKLKAKIDRVKKCEMCGVWIYGSKAQKRCHICSRRVDNLRGDKRIRRNGKPDLSITLEKLYNRDLGICQICNRVIIFGNDTNADYYPSIDHIKPLSKGGTHTWDNVQLACRKCNTIKGAKIS